MKLMIIGGVAGGATAAARARRINEQAEIILVERGEFISFANCGLPYYIGEVIKSRDSLLVTTAKAFRDRYRIDIRLFSEALAIDRKKKQVVIKNLATGKVYHESYDKLIISPGAQPIRPNFEDMESSPVFTLRNIPDTDRIKDFIDTRNPASAVIIGGGFIGLEMAENLVLRGVKTTVVEKQNQVMPPIDYEMAALIQLYLEEKSVTCICGEGMKSFVKKNGRLIVFTDTGREIETDMIILSVGIKPENHLAKEACLQIGGLGGIRVDAAMRTSDPDIYAVGDAVEVSDYLTGKNVITALAGPANKQARIAADNVMGRSSLFKGTLATSIVKIFDITVASTGNSEKMLRAQNIAYLTSHTHSGSHASYYPGAEMMTIKLLFSPGNGRILGAQIVGKEGVDKRIDVLATAICGSMTVFQLEELELAYAPPYSSAKDPINIAGFVAANLLRGDVVNVNWDQLPHIDPKTEILIDLRGKDELDKLGTIEGALHIPLPELRSRISELDPDKKYTLFCAVGMRGYIGHRILTQHGFDSRNLSGGYRTFSAVNEKTIKELI